MTIITGGASGARRWPRARRLANPLLVVRSLLSGRTWLATTHLIVGPLAALAALVVLALGCLFTLGRGAGVAARIALSIQESRFAVFLGRRIVPAPPGGWRHTLRNDHQRPWPVGTGRQLAYHLRAVLASTVFAGAVAGWWTAGLTFATIRWHGRYLHRDELFWLNPSATALTVGGLLSLVLAPVLVRWLAEVDTSMTRAMLRPSDTAQLTQRIESLTVSRAEVVAAADAERRRIERDLHDGAQQRLVSLAMHLGITRAGAADLPEDARRAIAQAHDEAKQALTELRDFVRGLHPAVLDDLGLDAALSGVAARCPVPVRLRTELSHRPPRQIEQVAYFVIAEALTNAAKHSGADSVTVEVRYRDTAPFGGRLDITVRDNGRGGARLDHGGGLRGLAQRVSSVDGTLRLSSPEGGPTSIEVALPCES